MAGIPVTVVGNIATEVEHKVTSAGLNVATFRMGVTERRRDRETNAWVDGDTSWVSITVFRQLAANAAASLKKGNRVIVAGKFKVREWKTDDKSGTDVEIVADAIGPDLMWGTTTFQRTPRPEAATDAAATDAAVADAAVASDADAPQEPAVAVPF